MTVAPVHAGLILRPSRANVQSAGTWRPDGTWLHPTPAVNGPATLSCHTSHLSTFAIQPLPRVEAVSGCGRQSGPVSVFCTLEAGVVLTISGGHFGTSAAEVVLIGTANGAQWPCAAVTHLPGAEDTTLTCQVCHRAWLCGVWEQGRRGRAWLGQARGTVRLGVADGGQ